MDYSAMNKIWVTQQYQHKAQLKSTNSIPNQLIFIDYRDKFGIKHVE